MAYRNPPAALRTTFKTPSSTLKPLPSSSALVAAHQPSKTPLDKGKGRERDSGVALPDEDSDDDLVVLDEVRVWNIQWREPQARKNKSWENDGYLLLTGEAAIIRDEHHKPIGSGKLAYNFDQTMTEFKVGGKECALDVSISWTEYSILTGEGAIRSGSTQSSNTSRPLPRPAPTAVFSHRIPPRPFVPLMPSSARPLVPSISSVKARPKVPTVEPEQEEDEIENSPPKVKRKLATLKLSSDDETESAPKRRPSVAAAAGPSRSNSVSLHPRAPSLPAARPSASMDLDDDELEIEPPSAAQHPRNLADSMMVDGEEEDRRSAHENSPILVTEVIKGPQGTQLSMVGLRERSSSVTTESQRRPLQMMKQGGLVPNKPSAEVRRLYSCLYRARNSKKSTSFESDGVLVQIGRKVTLKSIETGKDVAIGITNGQPFQLGDLVPVSGREVQIEGFLLAAEYDSGSVFKKPVVPVATPAVDAPPPAAFRPVIKPTAFYGGGTALRHKQAGPLFDPLEEGAVVMKRPDDAHALKWNKKNLPIVDVVIDPILSKFLRPHQKEGVKFMYECVMGMQGEGQGCILADEMGLGKTIQAISLVWTLLKQSPYFGGGTVISRAAIICPVTLLKNWSQEINKWLGRNKVGIFIADGKSDIKSFVVSKTYNILIIGYEKLNSVIEVLKTAQPPIGLVICDEGHRLKSAATKIAKNIRLFKTLRRVILSGTPIQNDLSEYHSMVDFVNPGTLDTYAVFKKFFESTIVKSREPKASKQLQALGQSRSDQLTRVGKTFILRRTGDVIAQFLPPKLEYVVFIIPTKLQIDLYTAILGTDAARDLLSDDSGAGAGAGAQLVLMSVLRKLCNSPGLLSRQVQEGKGLDVLNGPVLKLLKQVVDPNDFAYSGKFMALGSLLDALNQEAEEKIIIVSNFTSTLDIIEAHCTAKRYSFCRLDGKTKQEDRMPMVGSFNSGPVKKNFIFLLSSKSGGTGLNLIGASRLVLVDSDWNPSVDLQAMARIHREGQKKPCYIYRFLTAGTLDEKIFQRQVTKIGLSESLMNDKDQAAFGAAKLDAFTSAELRTVFRLHVGVTCQTHDLLECRCHLGEHDAAKVVEISSQADSSSQDEPVVRRGFTQASEYKAELSQLDPKERKSLSLLNEWNHHHCTEEQQADQIEDDLLRGVVYSRVVDASSEDGHAVEETETILRGGHVSFAFSKKS